MKKGVLFTLLLATVVAQVQAQPEDPGIESAKAKLAMKLKDPESARYADVVKAEKGSMVCGWVNSKNSYGGYVGFQPFFVVGDQVVIRDSTAGSVSNQGFFASLWGACIPATDESFGNALVDLPKINIEKQCAKKRERSANRPELYANCETREAEARAWLETHHTSESLARQCAVDARRYDSYGMAQSCVTNGETDIVIRRGPRSSINPAGE